MVLALHELIKPDASGTRAGRPLGFLHCNGCPDNAACARAVGHFNTDVYIGGIFDPADSDNSLPEGITTRSFFVGERAPCLVLDELAVPLFVEKELGHLPKFLRLRRASVPLVLLEDRSANLAIPCQ